MTTRRNFLRIGALFVPALAVPRVAYSFLNGAGLAPRVGASQWTHGPLIYRGPHTYQVATNWEHAMGPLRVTPSSVEWAKLRDAVSG